MRPHLFCAQKSKGTNTGRIRRINAHLLFLVMPMTCISIGRTKTFDAPRGIVGETIIVLAFRQRCPQRELEMGDAIEPLGHPGSTHSLLEERLNAALFFVP